MCSSSLSHSTNFMQPRAPIHTVATLEGLKRASGNKKALHTTMLPVMVVPLAAPCSRLTSL